LWQYPFSTNDNSADRFGNQGTYLILKEGIVLGTHGGGTVWIGECLTIRARERRDKDDGSKIEEEA
jgi:hypothetical protein